MKKKIDEIIFRKDLYPRFEPDVKKIGEYSENVERLPAIVINQDNILIDGWHRIKAHKQAKLDEIDIVVENTESENALYMRSIELNSTHGLQLSYKDKKSIAVKLYDGKNADRLVKALSVSTRTFGGWTSGKTRQMKEERNERILDLYLKCWTQEQIAEDVGIPQQTITDVLKQITENGKIAEIGKMVNFSPYLYNIWKQLEINNEQKYFGNFPIEYMENLLYYYTEPFDIVYDPFVGGGVTIDACKKWYRRYYVSDLNPIPAREEEIKKWDILDGPPDDLPKPDFVFLDPPYWKQAEGRYSKDKTDLGNMGLDTFYDAMKTFMASLKKKMRAGGRVAFVIQGTQWKNDLVFEDHAFEFMKMLDGFGFEEEQRIICPYSTQQYNAAQVDKAKKEKIFLNLHRDLVIFKKPEK